MCHVINQCNSHNNPMREVLNLFLVVMNALEAPLGQDHLSVLLTALSSAVRILPNTRWERHKFFFVLKNLCFSNRETEAQEN